MGQRRSFPESDLLFAARAVEGEEEGVCLVLGRWTLHVFLTMGVVGVLTVLFFTGGHEEVRWQAGGGHDAGACGVEPSLRQILPNHSIIIPYRTILEQIIFASYPNTASSHSDVFLSLYPLHRLWKRYERLEESPVDIELYMTGFIGFTARTGLNMLNEERMPE